MYRSEVPQAALELLGDLDYSLDEQECLGTAHDQLLSHELEAAEAIVERIFNPRYPEELPVTLGAYQRFLEERVASKEELIGLVAGSADQRNALVSASAIRAHLRDAMLQKHVPRDVAKRWRTTLAATHGDVLMAYMELLTSNSSEDE